MGVEKPRADTGDMGRILLRLRDYLENTKLQLKNATPDSHQEIIDNCSVFLVNESEKIASLQDTVLGSSESFQQLPPIRISDETNEAEGDLGARVTKLMQRASKATGLNLNIDDGMTQKAITCTDTAPTIDYEVESIKPHSLPPLSNLPQKIDMDYIGDRRGHKINPDKVVKGSNISNLPVRSKNRPQLKTTEVNIGKSDIQRGILNMIDRGLVPPAADIELRPSPIIHEQAVLNASRQHVEAMKDRTRTHIDDEPDRSDAIVKYDVNHKDSMPARTPMPPPVTPSNNQNNAGMFYMGSIIRYDANNVQNGLVDVYSIIIEHGVTRCNEIACLDHLGEELWITAKDEILPQLEEIGSDYTIPLMVITKSSLKKICEWAQLATPRKISKREIINCIENKEDVVRYMNQPGRLYTGPRRKHLAALKITSLFKAKLQRRKFLDYRRRQQAAGIIAVSWIMTVRMRRRRQTLIEQRKMRLDSYYARRERLQVAWPFKPQEKKVIIHLPSLSYPKRVRFSAPDLERRQMSQISRLVDSTDPNTHVIFISPMPFTDDLQRYYCRLLGIKPALTTRHPGNLEPAEVVESRFTVIVPEAIPKFPTHCLNLAQHLNYSSEALARLRTLITGSNAILVPGVVCHDTLAVAHFLDVPVYGSDPEVTHLYSTKSGARRIFQAAGVETPPGEYDIYNIQQLTECLAQLITTYSEISKWLIKLDCQFDNRGTYVLDVAQHLPCLQSVRRERQKYGDNWKHKSFQQTSYLYVLNQLPNAIKKCEAANSAVAAAYPTWDEFQNELCRQGGIIEAVPAASEVTNISLDFEIEPNGKINILTCGDQIHSGPFACWGWSLPQSSIPPEVFTRIVTKIAEASKSRKILGYAKVNLLTFLDEQNQQHVWATTMKIAPSDLLYMTKLLEFSTNTKLDAKSSSLEVEVEAVERQTKEVIIQSTRKNINNSALTRKNTTMNKVIRKQERYAVLSAQLLHTNLAILHYTVFFQMCRAHAIGWDVRSKIGTLFTLLDTVKRENIGMIYCGHNLSDAINNFARGLHVIHEEISAPNMQGTTNFHAVMGYIDVILEQISANTQPDPNSSVAIKLAASLERLSSEALLDKDEENPEES